MSPAEYDAGGVLPAGVPAQNTTGRPQRIVPAGVLACRWPDGHHAPDCDWRLHVDQHGQREGGTGD